MCVVVVGGRRTLGSDTRCCYFFPTDTPPAALGAKMEGEIPAAPSSTRRCTPSSATTKESSSFQPGSLAVCGSVSSELVNNEAPIMQYRQPHELAQHSIELPQKHHTNKYIKQPHHRQPDRPAPRASQLSPVPFSPKYGLRRRCRQRATWATVRRWRKVGFVSWSSRRASVSMKIVLVVSTPRITNSLWHGLNLRQLPKRGRDTLASETAISSIVFGSRRGICCHAGAQMCGGRAFRHGGTRLQPPSRWFSCAD